jgi:hypothetical protein
MLVILDETAKHDGKYGWTHMNLAFYAHWCNATESDMGKALRQLEKAPEAGGYGLLRSKRDGRMKVYQFIPERIQSLGDRERRTLRKPVQSAEFHGEGRANVNEGGLKMENVETTAVIETQVAVDSKCDSPSLQCLAESVGEAGAANCRPEFTGNRQPATTPPGSIDESRVTSTDESPSASELEDFCVLHLTPKLGNCPSPQLLAKVQRILGDCPLSHLKAHVLRRLDAVTGWGFVSILAEDVAQAFTKLRHARKRNPVQYDLEPDWASAAHVRALYSSGETPETVKAELILMWPELERQRKTPKLIEPIDWSKIAREKDKEREARQKR